MGTLDTSARAVLIDLDGTLVDSAPDIVAAANRMLEELNAAPLPFDKVSSFIGKGVPNLVRCVLLASGLSDRVDAAFAEELFYQHYRETNGRFGTVFPGVREGLSALKDAGYRLACVTNKPFGLAETLLQIARLDGYFSTLIGGDSIPQMKPAPEPLLHACQLLEASPARAVMVGDSGVDVAAASAAGMPVYIVRYGYPGPAGLDALRCDAFIDSFEQLAALLAEPSTTSERELSS